MAGSQLQLKIADEQHQQTFYARTHASSKTASASITPSLRATNIKVFTAINVILSTVLGVFALYDRFSAPSYSGTGFQTAVAPMSSTGGVFGEANFWITAFATVIVVYLVLLTAMFTMMTFFFDIVLLPFGQHFPVTLTMWDFVWNRVVMDMYWSHRNEWGVVAGIVLLLLFAFVSSQSD